MSADLINLKLFDNNAWFYRIVWYYGHNLNETRRQKVTIKDTQNSETGSGIYQSGNNGTFVLFHGITSKEYKTERGALKAWQKLVDADLV